MRFMMMIKNDEQAEAGQLPDPKLFEAMNQYNQALVDAGALIDADGLLPSSQGKIVRIEGGKATVTDGPFAEAKEVIGGYWLITAKSLDEAVGWAKRCFETVATAMGAPAGSLVEVSAQEGASEEGAGEIEVRQLFDLEDFPVNENESGWREAEAAERAAPTVQPKPGLKRFIGFVMANAETEAGVLPTEEQLASMGAYTAEAIRNGMLLAGEGLQRSANGAKVRFSKGKISVIDGPFTESKELIAGFSIFQAESIDEIVELSKRWPRENGDVELRIRQIAGLDDLKDAMPPEVQEQQQRMREQVAAQHKATA